MWKIAASTGIQTHQLHHRASIYHLELKHIYTLLLAPSQTIIIIDLICLQGVNKVIASD